MILLEILRSKNSRYTSLLRDSYLSISSLLLIVAITFTYQVRIPLLALCLVRH